MSSTRSSIDPTSGVPPMPPLDQPFSNEPYYNTWIKRDEAIFLIKNRYQAQSLETFFRKKLAGDEDIENDEFRMQIHVNFNLEILRFCLNTEFTAEQISTFLAVLNSVFRDSLKKKLTTDTSFENLEKILNLYTNQSPPFSNQIFTQSDKQKALGFVTQLYKFFQMYEISMTKFVDFNIVTQEFFPASPKEHELDTGVALSKQVY